MIETTDEQLVRVLSGSRSLAFDPEGQERDVDRVAALGMAQSVPHHERQVENANRARLESYRCRVGRHAIAFRQANDQKSHPALVNDLAYLVNARLGYIENPALRLWSAKKIARQAIVERVIDICHRCTGKGEVKVGLEKVIGRQSMTVCPVCNGERKRIWTNGERAESMKLEPNDIRVREKVDQAVEILIACEKSIQAHFKETRGDLFD